MHGYHLLVGEGRYLLRNVANTYTPMCNYQTNALFSYFRRTMPFLSPTPTLHDFDKLGSFSRRKHFLRNKFFSRGNKRTNAYKHRNIHNSYRLRHIYTAYKPKQKQKRRSNIQQSSVSSLFRALPNFISFLIRLFYITKTKMEDLMLHNPKLSLNTDACFSSVYYRFLLFWRAIVFFRCFKQTVNLPDCLVFFNPDNQQAPFMDFSGINVPVISIADSNSYAHRITYLIPSNDDSLILLLFYFLLFLNACDFAMSSRYSSFF